MKSYSPAVLFALSSILSNANGALTTCKVDPCLSTLKVVKAIASPFCEAYIASTATTTKTSTLPTPKTCGTLAGSTVQPSATKATLPPLLAAISKYVGPPLSSACSCLVSTNAKTETVTASAFVYPSGAATSCQPQTTGKVRIEGLNHTIFEGTVASGPRDITTPSGGTHHCDGTNNHQSQTPGATCTTALDAAAKLKSFSYDGTYDSIFDDYFITSIGGDTQTSTQFWGLLLDFQFTPVGGCQQEVQTGQEVLWAFDAFNKAHFLKLQGPATAKKNTAFSVTVTDGPNGNAIQGAVVGGATTDENGMATVTIATKGTVILKAEKSDSIRSNGLTVVVS